MADNLPMVSYSVRQFYNVLFIYLLILFINFLFVNFLLRVISFFFGISLCKLILEYNCSLDYTGILILMSKIFYSEKIIFIIYYLSIVNNLYYPLYALFSCI